METETTYTRIETRTDTFDQIAKIIYYFVGAINVLLLLRLIFRAFGANPGSPVVQFTYSLSGALLAPFQGIFAPAIAGESVIEPAIIVAMIIYSLLAKGLVELIYILAKRDTRPID